MFRYVPKNPFLNLIAGMDETDRPPLPKTQKQKKYLGKAHLREALLMHEEALRINRMCPELRNKDALQIVIKHFHTRYRYGIKILGFSREIVFSYYLSKVKWNSTFPVVVLVYTIPPLI